MAEKNPKIKVADAQALVENTTSSVASVSRRNLDVTPGDDNRMQRALINATGNVKNEINAHPKADDLAKALMEDCEQGIPLVTRYPVDGGPVTATVTHNRQNPDVAEITFTGLTAGTKFFAEDVHGLDHACHDIVHNTGNPIKVAKKAPRK